MGAKYTQPAYPARHQATERWDPWAPQAHRSGLNGGARARATTAWFAGDHRRCGARQGTGEGAFDAGGSGAPQIDGATH